MDDIYIPQESIASQVTAGAANPVSAGAVSQAIASAVATLQSSISGIVHPSQISEFENDAGYITESDIPEVDLTPYVTRSEIEDEIDFDVLSASSITLNGESMVDLLDAKVDKESYRSGDMSSIKFVRTMTYNDTNIKMFRVKHCETEFGEPITLWGADNDDKGVYYSTDGSTLQICKVWNANKSGDDKWIDFKFSTPLTARITYIDIGKDVNGKNVAIATAWEPQFFGEGQQDELKASYFLSNDLIHWYPFTLGDTEGIWRVSYINKYNMFLLNISGASRDAGGSAARYEKGNLPSAGRSMIGGKIPDADNLVSFAGFNALPAVDNTILGTTGSIEVEDGILVFTDKFEDVAAPSWTDVKAYKMTNVTFNGNNVSGYTITAVPEITIARVLSDTTGNADGQAIMRGLAYGNGILVVGIERAYNGRSALIESYDFNTGTYHSFQLNDIVSGGDINHAIFKDGWFYVSTKVALFKSQDGATWTQIPAYQADGTTPQTLKFYYIDIADNGNIYLGANTPYSPLFVDESNSEY